MADINPNALLEFARTITTGSQSKSGARLATVTRVDENGTAYVQLPGGEESPIGTTGAVYNIGDVVSVSMYGGKLRTVDNITAPSVSERVVRAAVKPISKAADLAKAAANEADKVATAINQHFWADDNGVHVTEADHDATTEHNILINSLGILLRKASNYLVSITQSAIAFYDGAGNADVNITARFGTDGAQVGKSDESHIEINADSFRVINKVVYGDVIETFNSAHIGINTDEEVPWFPGPYYTFGTRKEATSVHSSSQTYKKGELIISPYGGDFVCVANINTPGSWESQFSVGYWSPHPERWSYALGQDVVSHGLGAYACGEGTVSVSEAAHAQNKGTIAASVAQTAIGKYNVEDSSDEYALIVGNGTADNARSNALAVKWDGTVEHAGDVAWTNLPLSSGWQAYSSNWTPKYRRVGQMVEVRGAVSPTAATLLDTTDVVFATLPQGCRPNMTVTQLCQASSVKMWTLTIDSSGYVRAGRLRTTNSTSYQTAGTNEWLVFDVTFLI